MVPLGVAAMEKSEKNNVKATDAVWLLLVPVTVKFKGFAEVCDNPVVNGTPSGNYNIVLTGTLGNGSGVQRTTTITLSVLP